MQTSDLEGNLGPGSSLKNLKIKRLIWHDLFLARNPIFPLISGLMIDGHGDVHETLKSLEVPSESAKINSYSLWVSAVQIHSLKTVREFQDHLSWKSRNLFSSMLYIRSLVSNYKKGGIWLHMTPILFCVGSDSYSCKISSFPPPWVDPYFLATYLPYSNIWTVSKLWMIYL